VGLRGAVSVFLAAIPMLVGLPGAHFYFDVAFVVVMVSLAVQGWTIAAAARLLHVSLPRADVTAHRTELDLPGQLAQELVGYPVVAESPYLRRGISPSWAKLTLVVRDQRVHTPEEAASVREGDHVYFLAPPDRVQALDRFFAERPPLSSADANLVEDFFVPGEATLGALAEIYGLTVPAEDAPTRLADHFAGYFKHAPRAGDAIRIGPVVLVAHTVTDSRVVMVGLQLAEPEPVPRTLWDRVRILGRRGLRRLRARLRRPRR
jgi:cell volume regulation protein A